jgi:hypothetical protein
MRESISILGQLRNSSVAGIAADDGQTARGIKKTVPLAPQRLSAKATTSYVDGVIYVMLTSPLSPETN